MSKGRLATAIAVIVLLTVCLRAPLLDIPFERDEGEYAYIGWRLEYNELPYRDWVSQKPPAIFWIYRLALSLPLSPIRSVHFMGLLVSAASAVSLFFLALRFMGMTWATAAAMLFAALSADPLIQGTAANTELFMLLPLILSQIALLRASREGARAILWMFLAGALTGIAAAFKQVAAVNWLFLALLYPLLAGHDAPTRKMLSFAGWSALGCAAVWGVIAGYFAHRHGLSDFIYYVFTHNLEYISALPWPDRLQACWQTLRTLGRSQAMIWIMALSGLIVMTAEGKKELVLFQAGWLFASMIGVSTSGYYFPHYFQQALPPLALLAICGGEGLYRAGIWRRIPGLLRGIVLVAVFSVLPMVKFAPFLFSYSPADAVRKIYPGNFFAEMPEFGREIAALTRPDERVYVFGSDPEVLFYAHRVSATKYIILFPLYGPYANASAEQSAAEKDIMDSNPAAAVFLPNDLFFMQGSEQSFTRWSLKYLKDNFLAETYLLTDAMGNPRLIGGESREMLSLPVGDTLMGAVLVRKTPFEQGLAPK